MQVLTKKTAPRELTLSGTTAQRERTPMDTTKTTAPSTQSPATECFACYEGVVFIGHIIEDEDGDTTEVFEPVPCRRCASR